MGKTSRSPSILSTRVARTAALTLAAVGLALPAEAAFLQTNLVSSIPGLATITDPLLINPWGIARSPTSPFWVSNQGNNTSTLYAVTGKTNVSAVTAVNAQGFVGIPTTAAGPQGPTGQVNNTNTASFQLTPGTPSTSSRFLFADLNGQISGWAGGLSSTAMVTTPGAVYTGLAINAAGTRLYAANDAGTGSINVFDASFASVSLPELLRRSQVVSLHTPLTEVTRGLVGAQELALMRSDAILVNTSRGGVVDGVALVEALRSGSIGGAAIDVHESEPLPAGHPLTTFDSVVLTPHLAWYTEESYDELKRRTVANAIDVCAGRTPRNIVNPEVLGAPGRNKAMGAALIAPGALSEKGA